MDHYKAAAELSGCSRDWIVRLCGQGKALRVQKIEGRWFVDKEDFERWLAEQKANANGHSGPR